MQDGPVELLPFLFLGSAIHSSRRETLAAAGITAVLNVSSTCPNFYEGEFEYLRLTVEDSLAADIRACFSTAIAFIGEFVHAPAPHRPARTPRVHGKCPVFFKCARNLFSLSCSCRQCNRLITKQRDYDKLQKRDLLVCAVSF